MFKDKRGQGLSMNIVVVAIIAVIVLVVIALIFTGGVSKVWNTMGDFFQIGTTGRTLEFIQQQCNIACSSAKTMTELTRANSGYCTKRFEWDNDGDGEINEGVEDDYRCWHPAINVPCAGVRDRCS